MYNSILVPVESSHIKESTDAIELARKLGSESAKIVLFNVFEEIPKWASTNLPKNVIENSIRSIEEEMDTVIADTGSNIKSEVRVGHSYKTILEAADEMSADLIIVTSHQPAAQDYFLGSTSAKVVRHARCSVMVLR